MASDFDADPTEAKHFAAFENGAELLLLLQASVFDRPINLFVRNLYGNEEDVKTPSL